MFPVGEVLLRPLEANYPPSEPPKHVDGIVIMGGAENPQATLRWGPPQFQDSAERIIEAAAFDLRP